MPSTRALKNRIRSVDSTKQITKAMQLVAASKMRRAQEADKASAPYTNGGGRIAVLFGEPRRNRQSSAVRQAKDK